MHGLVQLVVLLFLFSLIGVAILAVRLAQGPLPMAGLARQIAAAASTPGRTLSIGGAELTWEGLHGGIDRPLDVMLHDVTLINADGQTEISVGRVEVSLSLIDLLVGRVAPRAVALDRPSLHIDMAATSPSDGKPVWRGQVIEALQTLRAPTTHSLAVPAMYAQLRRLRLTNAALSLNNDALGVSGALSDVEINLLRGARGGVSVHGAAILELGGGRVAFQVSGDLADGSSDIALGLTVEPFMPGWLASDMTLLAPLNVAQLPVGISGTLALDSQLGFRKAALDVTAQRGTLLLGDGALPLRSAQLHADITATQLQLQLRDLVLQATDASTPTHITAEINAHLANAPPPYPPAPGTPVGPPDQLAADINVTIDQAGVDDLAALWPLGVGGPGTRPWLVANAHGGVLKNGHAAVSLTAPLDFSDANVSKLTGGMDGSDIDVTWLSPVPPVERSAGRLVFVDPDTLDILLTAGRQSGTQITTKHGKLRMTGLSAHDQFLKMDIDLTGPFEDVVRLLHHKRIGLLDKRPIVMRDPSGQVATKLQVNLPLETNLQMDDVAIRAVGQLSDGHIGGIAGGRDVDRANLNFDVSNAGLSLNGTAQMAGMPSQIAAMMDFRPGGPAQVIEKVDVNATITGEQLTTLAINPDRAITGSVGAQMTYIERRGGQDDIGLALDLNNAGVSNGMLAWTKQPGTPGQFALHATMRAGQITAIDKLRADAPGLLVRSHADTQAGKPSVLYIDALKIGETTDLTGTVRLPARDGEPTIATLSGPALDLSGLLTHDNGKSDNSKRGPAYRLDVRVDRMTMAGGNVWKNANAQLESDGWITTHADVSAISGSGLMALQITKQADGRTMHATAQDAGAMLAALDISQRIAGGTLLAEGRYDDSNIAHKLSGTATLENFRLPNAPAIGRLLQALSVYGIFEAASGSGLGLTRMTAPFDLTTSALTLRDARAFSASLGFTAKGTIDLDAHAAQIEGTVIPLYFFNSLLGRLPLVGQLFSPEKEGGLFAVNFSIRGKLDDPSVAVNPLSALTPGVLRGFFDLFSPSTPPRP